MAYDADQILVGANGSIHVAPTGSTAPTDASSALDAAFIDLGAISDNGAAVQDAKTLQPIRIWQSFYPVRRLITERDFTITFALSEWSDATVELAFGGTVTEPDPTGAAGEYKLTPPSPETVDERMLVLEWADGTKNYRLVIPSGMVQDAVNTQLVRTTNSELPITFGVTGTDGSDPWYILTDDPAMNPGA